MNTERVIRLLRYWHEAVVRSLEELVYGPLVQVGGFVVNELKRMPEPLDPATPLAQTIASLGNAVVKGPEKWREVVNTPAQSDGQCFKMNLDAELVNLRGDRGNINMEIQGRLRVAAYEGETLSVLRELVDGPMSEYPVVRLHFEAMENAGYVFVIVRDDLPPFRPEEIEAINSGKLLTGSDYGRAWGLSVMHRVVKWGEGCIVVSTGDEGNRVAVRLPLWVDKPEKPA